MNTMEKLLEISKYTRITKNNRKYRVREGSTSHRRWLATQESLPWGYYKTKAGNIRKTEERLKVEKQKKAIDAVKLQAVKRVQELAREREEREAERARVLESEKAMVNEILALPAKERKMKRTPNVLQINRFIPTNIRDLPNINRILIKAGRKQISMVAETNPQGSFVIAIRFHTENNGQYSSIYLADAHKRTIDSLMDEFETKFSELSSSANEPLPIALDINIITVPTSGGCGEENRGHNIDKFMPSCRIWLASPKSKNNNCAISCFMHYLGIKGNKVRPDTVRIKCGFARNAPIDYKDLPKLADYFRCSVRVFVHPMMNENDHALEYIQPDYTDPINIHLIAGHYEYERERSHYIKCTRCGLGVTKDATTGKYRGKRATTKEKETSQCEVCSADRESYYQMVVKGRSIVGRLSPMNHKPPNPRDIVYFDIETFQPTWHNHSIPYAVGWIDGTQDEPTIEYGKDSFEKFVNWAAQQENKTFIAHNGSLFDFYPLMNRLLKKSQTLADQGIKMEKEKVVISNGRILKLEFGKEGCMNRVWDSCQFLLAGLDSCGEDFGCDFQKGFLDHDSIRTWDDVSRIKDECTKYLKIDVFLLREVCEKFTSSMHELDCVDVTKFMTLSQMSYQIWRTTLKESLDITYTKEQYQAISSSVYGGRVYPTLKKYISPKNGEIDFKAIRNDGLILADIVSLYPTAMVGFNNKKHYFPVGKCRDSTSPESDFKAEKMGIYYVKYEPPKDIVEPVLARKVKSMLIWDLIASEGWYTSVDIENAMEFGYKIEFTDKAVVWDKKECDLFTEYVNKYFKLKKDNKDKNKVLYQIAKTMVNALYGKMLQKGFRDARLWSNDPHEIVRWTTENKLEDMFLFEEAGVWMLQGKKSEDEYFKACKKPLHLGAFILAYSRRIMLEYGRMISPDLKTMFKAYGDTDSMLIRAEDFQKLKDMDMVGDELGMISNDIKNDGIITEYYGYAPKTYGTKYINNKNEIKTKIGAKGLKHELKIGEGLKKELVKFEYYQKGMADEKIHFHSIRKIYDKRPNQCEPFSIYVDREFGRDFLKTEWKRWDYDQKTGHFFPKGYEGNRQEAILRVH